MRVFCAAAMIAMLAGPVYAQSKPKTLEEMMDAKTPDQIEKEQAADRAYKESLKKIPDAEAPPIRGATLAARTRPRLQQSLLQRRSHRPKLVTRRIRVCMRSPQKITFAELREQGVRGLIAPQ